MHIATQGEELATTTVQLESSVGRSSSLHWDVPVTEEDEIPHQSGHGQLRGRGLPPNEFRPVALSVMVQVVRVEIVHSLTFPSCLMIRAFSSLKHVEDLEPTVVNLREPLHRHVLGEEPGVATCLGQIENHVLHQGTSEHIIVFERWSLPQVLVVLPRRAATIECLPLFDEIGLVLCVVLLAFGVFHSTADMIVIELMLLHESLPVLIRVEPLRLGDERDGRIVERDPESPGSVSEDVL
mmetsp:Transcript_53268/g.142557  ORF Transcript_53268/g.142557 Transcript_53268/m.142557 type:complete len:239 (-) Transcript_53268:420-1136(-)